MWRESRSFDALDPTLRTPLQLGLEEAPASSRAAVEARLGHAWQKPCLFFEAARFYRLKDGECDTERAFVCLWKGTF